MTDTLRDRIAAAVFQTRVNQGDPIVTMVDCNGIADAVIAALGLRYQLAPEGGPWTGHHRYLTDWKWEPINE